jgi:hypothetical protein
VIEVKSNVVEVKSNIAEKNAPNEGKSNYYYSYLARLLKTRPSAAQEKVSLKYFLPTIWRVLTDKPDVTELKQILDEKNREDLRLFLNPDLSVSDRLKEL